MLGQRRVYNLLALNQQLASTLGQQKTEILYRPTSPAPAMVVEKINVEDVSLVLSLIKSWTFRILAHEENQYIYV